MDLFEALAFLVIDDHDVIVGHVHDGGSVGLDEPALGQEYLCPASVGNILEHLSHRFLNFDGLGKYFLGSL